MKQQLCCLSHLYWFKKGGAKMTNLKFILLFKQEQYRTKLLTLFIEDTGNYYFVIGYRYESNFKIPGNRILDYWESGTYYTDLTKAIQDFSKEQK